MLAGLTLAAIVAMALVPRIPQDPSYHNFADQRALLGVPNFLNVVSNLPFLAVGIAGLLFLARPVFGECFLAQSERPAYLTFFLGIALTSFGSAYYHLAPSNERLVWDRLPMSIAFMSLLAAIIGERIDAKAGVISLLPLLMLGRIISGHTLKHLAAAVSAWCILRMIEGRVPKPSAASA